MKTDYVVIISADIEWRVVQSFFSTSVFRQSPLGDWFRYTYKGFDQLMKPVVLMHGGWGKVAAACSTQYAIDIWKPKLVVNLGTCGGFEGDTEVGEILLADKTIIYDIFEQMGDADKHIDHYSTKIDTSWIVEPLPLPVRQTLLVSGDRDLFCKDIKTLRLKYGAVAGDWESGAISWVANKNKTQCLILRGVSDLVGENNGQAYDGNIDLFYRNTQVIMNELLKSLPEWLLKYSKKKK
jgi:adenosylhomocysteine nucleosidase